MDSEYTIPLKSIVDEFLLETIYTPENFDEILIHKTEVNRPGLQLSGFFGHFEPTRIQIIGRAEHKYLEMLAPDERKQALTNFFETRPIAVVVSSGLEVFAEMLGERNGLLWIIVLLVDAVAFWRGWSLLELYAMKIGSDFI